VDENFLRFVLFGCLAQMIDGALGMAYGVSSTTLLLSIGIPPAVASASVHAAEVVTTAISGTTHFKLGNVDRVLFKKLVITGMLGGAAGALTLSYLPGDAIKPYVSLYLVIMGIVILIKALRQPSPQTVHTHLLPLGLLGGFMDAIGGGGWGPIVTTTLVARGNTPRTTIGSVNLTEFFVTLAETIVFGLTIGLTHWTTILGLLIGGAIAAPLGALASKRIPTRWLMLLVGILIIVLSLRTITLAIF